MSEIIKLNIKIVQSGFHNITDNIENILKNKILNKHSNSGILNLFCMHTSCALLINESWDSSAREDLEKFFNHIAPEDLPFIEHVLEGPDDSPAHMKSALLHQSLSLIVDDSKLVLGRWQGVFLAEFRRAACQRQVLLKYQPDLKN
ncbi:MAG: hypothetical protein S4CHLAM6_14150 [Chlamydiae bacterium]|nr:hypothetical protein [Chlamydiota bacterium]